MSGSVTVVFGEIVVMGEFRRVGRPGGSSLRLPSRNHMGRGVVDVLFAVGVDRSCFVVVLPSRSQYSAYLSLRRRSDGGGVGVVVGSGDGVGMGAVAAQGVLEADNGDGVGGGAVIVESVGEVGSGDGVGRDAAVAQNEVEVNGADGGMDGDIAGVDRAGGGVSADAAAAHSVPHLLLLLPGRRLASLSLSLSKSTFFQPWCLSQCCLAQACRFLFDQGVSFDFFLLGGCRL